MQSDDRISSFSHIFTSYTILKDYYLQYKGNDGLPEMHPFDQYKKNLTTKLLQLPLCCYDQQKSSKQIFCFDSLMRPILTSSKDQDHKIIKLIYIFDKILKQGMPTKEFSTWLMMNLAGLYHKIREKKAGVGIFKTYCKQCSEFELHKILGNSQLLYQIFPEELNEQYSNIIAQSLEVCSKDPENIAKLSLRQVMVEICLRIFVAYSIIKVWYDFQSIDNIGDIYELLSGGYLPEISEFNTLKPDKAPYCIDWKDGQPVMKLQSWYNNFKYVKFPEYKKTIAIEQYEKESYIIKDEHIFKAFKQIFSDFYSLELLLVDSHMPVEQRLKLQSYFLSGKQLQVINFQTALQLIDEHSLYKNIVLIVNVEQCLIDQINAQLVDKVYVMFCYGNERLNILNNHKICWLDNRQGIKYVQQKIYALKKSQNYNADSPNFSTIFSDQTKAKFSHLNLKYIMSPHDTRVSKNDFIDFIECHFEQLREEEQEKIEILMDYSIKRMRQDIKSGRFEQDIIQIYTYDSFFYKVFNRACRFLSNSLYTPYIRYPVHVMYSKINEKFNKNLRVSSHKLYRRCYLSQKQIEQFRNNIGRIVESEGFMSTSQSSSVNKKFGCHFIEISIPDMELSGTIGGFASICEESQYKNQREVLVNPLNFFYIRDVEIVQSEEFEQPINIKLQLVDLNRIRQKYIKKSLNEAQMKLVKFLGEVKNDIPNQGALFYQIGLLQKYLEYHIKKITHKFKNTDFTQTKLRLKWEDLINGKPGFEHNYKLIEKEILLKFPENIRKLPNIRSMLLHQLQQQIQKSKDVRDQFMFSMILYILRTKRELIRIFSECYIMIISRIEMLNQMNFQLRAKLEEKISFVEGLWEGASEEPLNIYFKTPGYYEGLQINLNIPGSIRQMNIQYYSSLVGKSVTHTPIDDKLSIKNYKIIQQIKRNLDIYYANNQNNMLCEYMKSKKSLLSYWVNHKFMATQLIQLYLYFMMFFLRMQESDQFFLASEIFKQLIDQLEESCQQVSLIEYKRFSHKYKAHYLRKTNQFKQAIQIYLILIEEGENQIQMYYYIIKCYNYSGSQQLSIHYLNHYIQILENCQASDISTIDLLILMYDQLAFAYLALNHDTNAIQFYKKVVKKAIAHEKDIPFEFEGLMVFEAIQTARMNLHLCGKNKVSLKVYPLLLQSLTIIKLDTISRQSYISSALQEFCLSGKPVQGFFLTRNLIPDCMIPQYLNLLYRCLSIVFMNVKDLPSMLSHIRELIQKIQNKANKQQQLRKYLQLINTFKSGKFIFPLNKHAKKIAEYQAQILLNPNDLFLQSQLQHQIIREQAQFWRQKYNQMTQNLQSQPNIPDNLSYSEFQKLKLKWNCQDYVEEEIQIYHHLSNYPLLIKQTKNHRQDILDRFRNKSATILKYCFGRQSAILRRFLKYTNQVNREFVIKFYMRFMMLFDIDSDISVISTYNIEIAKNITKPQTLQQSGIRMICSKEFMKDIYDSYFAKNRALYKFQEPSKEMISFLSFINGEQKTELDIILAYLHQANNAIKNKNNYLSIKSLQSSLNWAIGRFLRRQTKQSAILVQVLIQKLKNIYQRVQAQIISQKCSNFEKLVTENIFYRGGDVVQKINNIKQCFTSILYENISDAEKSPIIHMEIKNILKKNPYDKLAKLKHLMPKMDIQDQSLLQELTEIADKAFEDNQFHFSIALSQNLGLLFLQKILKNPHKDSINKYNEVLRALLIKLQSLNVYNKIQEYESLYEESQKILVKKSEYTDEEIQVKFQEIYLKHKKQYQND